MFGVAKGKLVNKFEGVPAREDLGAFFQSMMDAASAAVGPVAVANAEYQAALQVRLSSVYTVIYIRSAVVLA